MPLDARVGLSAAQLLLGELLLERPFVHVDIAKRAAILLRHNSHKVVGVLIDAEAKADAMYRRFPSRDAVDFTKVADTGVGRSPVGDKKNHIGT
jgi:hypothetical protein